MRLLLATKNKGKVEELRHLLGGLKFEIDSLLDHPEIPDVDEDGATFVDNARKKAVFASKAASCFALADDSGLVVDALGGRPGVQSARYAGEGHDYAANNTKLLEEMKFVPDGKRGSAFVCSMVLVAPDGREWAVEGRTEGVIGFELIGNGGFGYDPLFFIPSEGKTMAELPMERKNAISHRGRALAQMREILVAIIEKGK